MPSPIELIGIATMSFPAAFAASSGTATLFVSGTGNISSGAMPLYLRAADTKNSNMTLFMLAASKTYSWESLGNYWQSYNIACDSGATYFCQDWNYLPYSGVGASGKNAYLSMSISGAYRSARNYQMPLFMSCTGGGVINAFSTLFLYAQNNETKSSGAANLFTLGAAPYSGQITLSISGEMPSHSGSITMVCNSYDSSASTIKLFTSGI